MGCQTHLHRIMDKPNETNRVTDVCEEDDPNLQKFADENGVVLLAFVGSYVPRRYGPTEFGWSSMSVADEFSIEEALTTIIDKHPNKPRKLYLLVNTPGGLVASSLKIALAIRRCFDDIIVFVPHIAASGGTMLALTGNRIRMGMMSQLNPVDVQVSYKILSYLQTHYLWRKWTWRAGLPRSVLTSCHI